MRCRRTINRNRESSNLAEDLKGPTQVAVSCLCLAVQQSTASIGSSYKVRGFPCYLFRDRCTVPLGSSQHDRRRSSRITDDTEKTCENVSGSNVLWDYSLVLIPRLLGRPAHISLT